MNVAGAVRLTRTTLGIAKSVMEVAGGYASFRRTGRTPTAAYQAMRRLYFSTGGRSARLGGLLATILHPADTRFPVKGALGELTAAMCAEIADAIGRDGYHAFGPVLPAEAVRRLVRSARELPVSPTVPADQSTTWRGEAGLLEELRGSSNRFDLLTEPLLADPGVQAIMADPTLLAVASAYLGCAPVLDTIAMWWSTVSPQGASLAAESAQMFHADCDRVRFLKFFIYLTDVTTHSGPHVFVRGSHRKVAPGLLREGRVPDAEVERVYAPGDVVELSGPAGSILAVDTSGLHKGKALDTGERLVLQLQYAVSGFGQDYGPLPVSHPREELLSMAARHPRTFRELRFQG